MAETTGEPGDAPQTLESEATSRVTAGNAVPQAVSADHQQQLYHLTLTTVTGMLIVTQRRSRTFTGTEEQLEAAYGKVLRHNLLLGWWSIPIPPFAIVWTIMALMRNRKARARLKSLAQGTPPATQQAPQQNPQPPA